MPIGTFDGPAPGEIEWEPPRRVVIDVGMDEKPPRLLKCFECHTTMRRRPVNAYVCSVCGARWVLTLPGVPRPPCASPAPR